MMMDNDRCRHLLYGCHVAMYIKGVGGNGSGEKQGGGIGRGDE